MNEYRPPDRLQLNIPACESPFREEYAQRESLSSEDRAQLESVAKDGYVILDLQGDDFESLAAQVLADMAPRYPAGEHRVHDAWYFSEAVRQLAAHPEVLRLLRMLYGRRPIPFQTLNFDIGTQQPSHSDTIHFHCTPARFMCGVWVALEDIDENCGALRVHPGSHRLPDFDMLDLGLPPDAGHYQQYEDLVRWMLEAEGYEGRTVTLKKGQAIVWTANLYHGGSEIRKPGSTRHSQVTHYYFEDCLYYFPMGSERMGGKTCWREVIDLGQKCFVPHSYRGERTHIEMENVLRYPRPLPPFIEGPVLPQPPSAAERVGSGMKRWFGIR